MLDILGMIGKGIGIVLLCILLLLVVLLLTVLFVPIRYHLCGSKEEAGAPEGRIRVHWLFSLVSASAAWKGGLHYGLRICGIPVFGSDKEKRKKDKDSRKAARRRQKKSRKKKPPREESVPPAAREQTIADTEIQETVPKEQATQAPGDAAAQAPVTAQKEGSGSAITIPPQTAKQGEGENAETAEPASGGKEKRTGKKPGIRQRLAALWQKIVDFLRMLGGLIAKLLALPGNIEEKAAHLREKVAFYLAFVQSEEFRQAAALCKKQVWFLVRSIKPRKIRADIRFGFDDPATTGQILAFAGMIYPFLGKTVILRPDFEEALCSGTITVKGRIFLFDLLRIAWILYFNKNIKRVIRMWKKEEALHDRQ